MTALNQKDINCYYDLSIFNYQMAVWKPLLLRLSIQQDKSTLIAMTGNLNNLTVLVNDDISVGDSIYLAVDLDSIEVLVA